MNSNKLIHSLLQAVLVLTLQACGGSDGGGSPGDTTGGDTTGGDTTGGDTTGGDTTGGETTGGDSGLSHTAVEMPRGQAPSAGDALVSDIGKTQASTNAAALAMVFEVVENHSEDTGVNCTAIDAQYGSCSVVNLHIKDTTAALDGSDWKIFFHSIRRVLRVDSDEFSIFHVNGDLHYLTPVEGFAGFGQETVKSVKLITEFSHLHDSDMMPRYWLVRDGNVTLLANSTSATDSSNYAVPITGTNATAFNGEVTPLANADNRFERNADTVEPASVAAIVIPTPALSNPGTGELSLGSGFSFDTSVLSAASVAALTSRQSRFYNQAGSATAVATTLDTSMAADQYQLSVDATGVSIFGGSAESVYHGAQSLLSLITPGVATIPFIDISDAPRFAYRGMHVDVARHFHSLDSLRKLIDQMSAYKLNRLHMHLSDDEGWRLQIQGLPELTNVGAARRFQLDADGKVTESSGLMPQLGSGPNSDSAASGFYTRSQFIELLQYAAARYVNVIPEFDMPGHARAAIVAMRARAANAGTPGDTTTRLDDPADTSRYLTIQHYRDGLLNPCVPGTYNFIESVVTDVKAMFDAANMPLTTWHMGGDEAKNIFKGGGFPNLAGSTQYDFPWEQSPACQSLIASDASLNSLSDLVPHFISRLSSIVSNAGVDKLYAYQDIMSNINPATLATGTTGINFWESITRGGFASAYEWPNRGFETIIAVPDFLYFDHPQEVDPKERGYYWASRWTDTRKVFGFMPENLPQNAETSVNLEGNGYSASGSAASSGFAGMQGHIWSETVRTAEQFDSMVYPRLLALAERAWHKAGWELDYAPGSQYSANGSRTDRTALQNDWNSFASALGRKELIKLDAAGVGYRVPTVGVQTSNGALNMNTTYPGLPIEYSVSGDAFNAQTWNPAAPPASAAQVRARSANGARTGRITSATD